MPSLSTYLYLPGSVSRCVFVYVWFCDLPVGVCLSPAACLSRWHAHYCARCLRTCLPLWFFACIPMCLYVSLPVSLFYLLIFLCVFICMFFSLFSCLCLFLSLSLGLSVSVCSWLCQSLSVSFSVRASLSIYLCLSLCLRLSLYLSLCYSVCVISAYNDLYPVRDRGRSGEKLRHINTRMRCRRRLSLRFYALITRAISSCLHTHIYIILYMYTCMHKYTYTHTDMYICIYT